MIPDAVRLFAEEPDRYLSEPEPPARRLLDDRFVLFLGPTIFQNLGSSIRVEVEDVPVLVDEVRAHVGRDRRRVAWAVGPSCTPADLVVRLEELDFVPADRPPYEPVVTAMVLTEPPVVGGTEAVDVRPVTTFEDSVCSCRRAGTRRSNAARPRS